MISAHNPAANSAKTRVGRPRAGTENERHSQLLAQALELFMTEGVTQTSVARIAAHCGVSTRTIYERYDNKYELLIAAVAQMVEQDVSAMVQVDDLHKHSLNEVLTRIGRFILNRVLEPRMVSFYRIGVSEFYHVPELALAMKQAGPERLFQMLAEVLAFYAAQGSLPSVNFKQAAESYCELVIAGPRNKALFGALPADWDAEAHINFVVTLFLKGITGMEHNHG
ncbi:TetR/AcrR family transcriptional regulator [Methylophilus aquaticus]|uniref:TetR/AcrR family transcriptional regulator n=1 Tax=Methylophilus aquaticus TaxID=1971610 RepID=A0ABT9JQE7_9PROT|nr:TetR/AcrR family transcriptional regulator [Methylophilus aquaticus]MDP8566351.1 TetR/AcrR family transcriptional regulator [Methylophilus aquaticus]